VSISCQLHNVTQDINIDSRPGLAIRHFLPEEAVGLTPAYKTLLIPLSIHFSTKYLCSLPMASILFHVWISIHRQRQFKHLTASHAFYESTAWRREQHHYSSNNGNSSPRFDPVGT